MDKITLNLPDNLPAIIAKKNLSMVMSTILLLRLIIKHGN